MLMDNRKRMGRPPKPPKQRLSMCLRVKMTVDDYDALCVAALRQHIQLTDYVREALRRVMLAGLDLRGSIKS